MDSKAAESLLKTVCQRRKSEMAGESLAYNILAAIGRERDETHVHSRIICFLLNGSGNGDANDDFLHFFLQVLQIPPEYISGPWRVCREQAFEAGRIDFVIESEQFCAAIEMKIDAEDGPRQLERYDMFCRKKEKDYRIYYLTPDGRAPDRQSAGSMNRHKFCCISFRDEILNWLQMCMDTADQDSYRYSFLKQYAAAVRQMTESDSGVQSVKDLLANTETAKAALLIMDSFQEKMKEITEELFQNVGSILEKESRLQTVVYADCVDLVVDRIEWRGKTYCLMFELAIDHSLYAGFGFTEQSENTFLPLADAEKRFPKFYHTWVERIRALNLPKLWPGTYTLWYYIENTRGDKLNFHDKSDSVLELIDEMDLQSQYIGETIFQKALKPLLQYELH